MKLLICIAAAMGALACTPPNQARDGRTSYNAGLGLVAASDHENGIDLLGKARANAGTDGELRFRAAFALGESYASWAETVSSSEPKVAVDRFVRSESWFRDAIRQREDDADARINLAIVVRKRRALEDQLNAGNKGLGKQLDAALADQRVIRDELRQGEAALAQGVEAAVLAPAFAALATRERSLAADVGVVSDLAADERTEIEAVAQDQRTSEQQGRLAQLAALSHYLERARGSMADVRRSLRKDRIERGHRRSEAAVSELVRAREQLLDPASVLQALASDEMLLYSETRALASLRSPDIALGKGEPPALPPHLAGDRLEERQRFLHARASELSERLGAYAASEAPEGEPAEAAQTREVVASAAPFLAAAVKGMDAAAIELGAERGEAALAIEEDVVLNLARALEYFSGLRQLIELIAAQQGQAVALLDPEGGASLPTVERVRRLSETATLNRERLERLALLLASEKTRNLDQLKQAKPAGGAAEAAEPEGAREGIEARFARAETHRAAALAAVTAMAAALAARGGDALAPAKTAVTEVEELRRLFFSLIEHLEELHQRQGGTRDNTATAHGASDDERAALLPPLTTAQTEHSSLAGQIGEALAAQADQAASAEAQGQGPSPGAPDASKLSAAADEVRQANTRMQVAQQKLADATASAETMSVDLEPTLADQAAAIEHLAKAIELLSPPEQDQNKDGDQGEPPPKPDDKETDEADSKSQPAEPEPSDDLSQSDVDRRLRAIREREDERRRERERRPRSQTVEKDW